MPATILGTWSLYLNITFYISHFYSTKYYIFGERELFYIYVEFPQYVPSIFYYKAQALNMDSLHTFGKGK